MVAGGRYIRLATFSGIEAEAVEAYIVDESPVFEAHVSSCKVPFGPIRILVMGECSGNFSFNQNHKRTWPARSLPRVPHPSHCPCNKNALLHRSCDPFPSPWPTLLCCSMLSPLQPNRSRNRRLPLWFNG